MRKQTGYDSLLLRKHLEELEAKYPEHPDAYPEEDIAKISFCHYIEVDHLYRDFWGSRTALASYEGGRIELEAFVSRKILLENKHAKQRFINQIEAWFANRFLRKATSFLVHIYASQYDGTCTISHTEKELEKDTSLDFCPFIHEAPDIKVSEWLGRLGKASELIETPYAKWPANTY